MPESLRDAAKHFFDQHVPVVAVKQKKPLIEWARWQTDRQTIEEFEAQQWQEADGYAIICGTKLPSGLHVGAIDFDVKNVGQEAREQGRQILNRMLGTQIEETPSGGQHWIYYCHNKPRTVSVFHNECALEILGEGKLCIMAPSQCYRRVNDNTPSMIKDLEDSLLQAMYDSGFKPKATQQKPNTWFERTDLIGKRYLGKTPPCIEALYRGSKEGERNEHAIRLASFLANFRRIRADRVFETLKKLNKLNDPPLPDNELQTTARSAMEGGYVYGCTDPILKKSCLRDECPIAPANIVKMLSKEEIERAENLLNSGKLLDYLLNYGKQRLIGEDNALLLNFVMFCSGQTHYPISSVISGFSGSGKNESIRAIKPLLPKEWFFEFTTSTPEAIKYIPEEFAGTLVIYEAAGVKGDSGSLSLRAIGEGESIETIYPIRNELTGKMEMGRAKTNAKNFLTTSSDIDINPDLYRRVLKHTMNHSTELTKRVMAKKMRDAALPESLKKLLDLHSALPFSDADFQNALRLLDWKLEAVSFTPTELLKILDLAVKREQEVALRTHIEKIINFARVLALLKQRKRFRVRVDKQEYVVTEPDDFVKALDVLNASIMETVSRIEKRQEEVLKLFSTAGSLTKHDVASKLKISIITAYKALHTLAQNGYLKEDTSSRLYRYELLQETPNHVVLFENTSSISLFHRESLKNWLNSISSSRHQRAMGVEFYNPFDGSWSQNYEAYVNELSTSLSLLRRDDEVHLTPDSSVDCQTDQNHLVDSERTRCLSQNVADFKAVYWSDGFYGCHPCAVCGQKKLTSWQAETFKDEKLWLCEDCKTAWEKRQGNNQW
jgi:Fe2+ or Zn2+ uptake regulation protein